jgi:hypothetical protein
LGWSGAGAGSLGGRGGLGGRPLGGGYAAAGQDLFDPLEFVAFEFAAAGLFSGEPAVHEGQQIAAEAALIGVALEDFLRVVGVDRQFLAALMVAGAAEGTVDPHFGAAAFDVQADAAFGGGGLERGLGLQFVNIDVARSIHDVWGAGGRSVTVLRLACPIPLSSASAMRRC